MVSHTDSDCGISDERIESVPLGPDVTVDGWNWLVCGGLGQSRLCTDDHKWCNEPSCFGWVSV